MSALPRRDPQSERLMARDVARLLRSACDGKALRGCEIGRKLLSLSGTDLEALQWLDRAVASLTPLRASRTRGGRLARQAVIVARYDRCRESRSTILEDLGISRRLFYRERTRALVRLAALIEECELRRRPKFSSHQPFAAALAGVDAHDEAGETAHALSKLRALLSTVDTPGARFEVVSRMIVPLARCGRMAEAKHVAIEARRCLATAHTLEHSEAEGRLQLAELRRTHLQGTPSDYRRALVAFRAKLNSAAATGDQGAIGLLTAAMLEHAMDRVDAGDSPAAEEFLREAQALAGRTLELPLATQIQMSIVKLGIHVDQPEQFARTPREAAEVYRIARERGFVRLATQALYQLASIALISRKPHLAIRCGTTLLRYARNADDLHCFTRAHFALAGADYLLGRYDAALERLDAMKTEASAGSIHDMLVDALRARVLFGLGLSEDALATIQRVLLQASAEQMEQATALALLLKSRIAMSRNDVRGATYHVDAGLELLSRYPTPLQLVRAYQHAFTLTARKRYRDAANDVWKMIAPAFADDDHLISLDSRTDVSPLEDRSRRLTAKLTPRERAVAALVSGGKTNRETARCLGLSVRTVEGHVQSILRRLNVDHRWQIGVPTRDN